MAENEYSLKQKNALGFTFQIKLVDGRELQVLNKSKKSEQIYSVDILSLKDKSETVFSIAWKWLVGSISFLIFMLLLLKVLPLYLNENKNIYLGIILLSGVLGCILCFIQFWKHTFKKQIFYSRNAHVPIVILNSGKPTKKIFSSFISPVEERIKTFHEHMNLTEDKQLVGEMKMLRRLSDDGVISKKDYESAKTKLFSGFDSSNSTLNNL